MKRWKVSNDFILQELPSDGVVIILGIRVGRWYIRTNLATFIGVKIRVFFWFFSGYWLAISLIRRSWTAGVSINHHTPVFLPGYKLTLLCCFVRTLMDTQPNEDKQEKEEDGTKEVDYNANCAIWCCDNGSSCWHCPRGGTSRPKRPHLTAWVLRYFLCRNCHCHKQCVQHNSKTKLTSPVRVISDRKIWVVVAPTHKSWPDYHSKQFFSCEQFSMPSQKRFKLSAKTSVADNCPDASKNLLTTMIRSSNKQIDFTSPLVSACLQTSSENLPAVNIRSWASYRPSKFRFHDLLRLPVIPCYSLSFLAFMYFLLRSPFDEDYSSSFNISIASPQLCRALRLSEKLRRDSEWSCQR